MVQIVLASRSPRRSELLKQLGIDFVIKTADIDESNCMGFKAAQLVEYLAYEKAKAVVMQMNSHSCECDLNKASLVIGADTVVVKDGMILGKPYDKMDAFNMLKGLSGCWHEVMTGVAVIDASSTKCDKIVEVTRVKMKELDDNRINAYIASGEPLDKAGAYGIQGLGAVLIDRIEGSYFNVVGLPVSRLSDVLEKYGVQVLG